MCPQKYGYRADMEAGGDRQPCVVCDNPRPSFSWTDAHGEGYCTRCGTPYQIKGVDQPTCNIKDDAIPILRAFWAETQSPNGLGTFWGWDDYPDQLAGRRRFNEWDKKRNSESAEVA